MKKAILFISAFTALSFASCNKMHDCKKDKKDWSKSQIIRDCTGTYLRFEGKDFHVCNLETVAQRADGEYIYAEFTKTQNCTGSGADEIVCQMVHENAGWVTVTLVKGL